MQETAVRILEDLVEHRSAIKRAFPFHDSFSYITSAATCALAGGACDPKLIRSAARTVKKSAPALSLYRTDLFLTSATYLSMTAESAKRFQSALALYDSFRSHFSRDIYLAFASLLIANGSKVDSAESIADRTHLLYEEIKGRSMWLVGGNLASLCALVVAAGLESDVVIERMLRCFALLRSRFDAARGGQTLAHVIGIASNNVEAACDNVASLYDSIIAHGGAFGSSYELAGLATLAAATDDVDQAAEGVVEGAEWLSSQRGFGTLTSVTRQQRLLLSCHAVALGLIENAIENERTAPNAPATDMQTLDAPADHDLALFYQLGYLTTIATLSQTSTIAVGL